jgi:DNA-binding MarR family transcriptional regulator
MKKSDLEIIIQFPKITHVFMRKMMHGFTSSQIGMSLNRTQGRTLLLLYDKGKTTMTALHKAIGLEKGSLTGVIDQLIEKELVERARDASDRRKVNIFLTDKGLEKAEILRMEIAGYIKKNLEKLPVEDRKRFYGAAEALIDISHKL